MDSLTVTLNVSKSVLWKLHETIRVITRSDDWKILPNERSRHRENKNLRHI